LIFQNGHVYYDLLPPPSRVTIWNSGVGIKTEVTVDQSTKFSYYDQSLNSEFQIHQVANDRNETSTTSTNNTTTINAATSRIVTLGSNTRGLILKESNDNADDSSSMSIHLDGFQQVVTIVGVVEDNGGNVSADEIIVDGLSIRVYTTADCDTIQTNLTHVAHSDLNQDISDVFGEDGETLVAQQVQLERKTAREIERHPNFCYNFSMEQYDGQVFPKRTDTSVNASVFFANLKENTISGNNSSVNGTSSSYDPKPLPPSVRPTACLSSTSVENFVCFSGATLTRATMTLMFALSSITATFLLL